MVVRVVIPRWIRKSRTQRLMWRAWKHGYSSRVTSIAQPEGWMLVEFLIQVRPQVRDGLEAFELELDDALSSTRCVSGTGCRLERAEEAHGAKEQQ